MNAAREATASMPAGGRNGLLMILAVVFVVGTGLSVFALSGDPGPGMWGMLAANFLFLTGITQFGAAFPAIIRLTGGDWARPYFRIGQVAALACAPLTLILLLVLSGAGSELFWWADAGDDEHVPAWLDTGFLRARNLLALLAFYLYALLYTLHDLKHDISAEFASSGPGWRRRLAGWLLARRESREATANRLYRWSPGLLITGAIAQTFLAWDFGMMLYPHYHSTVFPMYYMIGNMFAGSAALLLLAVLYMRGRPDVVSHFGTEQIKQLGIMLTAFTLLWLYFFWAQFFVSWFGNLPYEYGVIKKKLFGHYSVFFWIQMIFIIGLPMASLIFAAVKRTWWTMIGICLIMNVGVWFNRYLIVLPALSENHSPFSSLYEVAAGFGLLAGFLMIALWLYGQLPMISTWEKGASASDS